jgi:hypothetical protein
MHIFCFLRKGGDSEYWLVMYELTCSTESTHDKFIPQIYALGTSLYNRESKDNIGVS